MAAKKFWRHGTDVETAWDTMDRYQRFKLLDSVAAADLDALGTTDDP